MCTVSLVIILKKVKIWRISNETSQFRSMVFCIINSDIERWDRIYNKQ